MLVLSVVENCVKKREKTSNKLAALVCNDAAKKDIL